MIRYTIPTTILATLTVAGHAYAYMGQAPPGVAMADYDPATGRMSVSVNGVNTGTLRVLPVA